MPAVSVIIVTFNSAAHVPACLQALRAHPPATSHDVLVVDNASSDGTPDLVRRHWTGVRLVETGANLGFAAANNRGLQATTGERVLLLNPDAAVEADTIDRLMAALDSDPSVAIAGPRVLDASGRAELSFGRHLSPLTEAVQKVLMVGQARGWPGVAGWVERQTQQPSYPDWVSGACWLARRDALDQAGRFDERFFLYTEDVDLCARVRQHGHRVAFVPAAVVRHVRGASRASLPDRANAHYRRSQLAFYEKHHPRWAPVLRTYLMLKGELPDTSTQRP